MRATAQQLVHLLTAGAGPVLQGIIWVAMQHWWLTQAHSGISDSTLLALCASVACLASARSKEGSQGVRSGCESRAAQSCRCGRQ
jgi:hypothetical protein